MDTKVLLTGIISFIAGGLLVSIAASTFNKPSDTGMNTGANAMVENLKDKQGDAFDKAFLSGMIVHHQDAVDMARMAEKQAKHEEVKSLSRAIISAQNKEISDMQQWQVNWNYDTNADSME